MFEKPSKALMIALRDFVCRHEIFVKAREFDDGFICPTTEGPVNEIRAASATRRLF